MKGLTVIAVTFNHSPWILEAFLASYARQTSDEWDMILLHDGSITDLDSTTRCSAIKTRRVVERYIKEGFPIEYIETEKRYNDWGHSLRAIGLEKATGLYTQFQNSDNWVTPVLVEYMVGGAQNGDMDISYCDILHSYPLNGKEGYNILDSRLCLNSIDMSNFIIKTELAKKVGFNHRSFAADGLFIEDVKRFKPSLKSKKIPRCLVVHN